MKKEVGHWKNDIPAVNSRKRMAKALGIGSMAVVLQAHPEFRVNSKRILEPVGGREIDGRLVGRG